MRAGRVGLWLLVVALAASCGTVGLDDAVSDGSNGAAVLLPDGDFEFGEVSPDARHAETLTVQVKSVGIDAVAVQDAWMDTDDSSVMYMATNPFPKRIEPGESVAFDVKFSPADQDHYHAVLHVTLETGGEITRNVLGIGCPDRTRDGICDSEQ